MSLSFDFKPLQGLTLASCLLAFLCILAQPAQAQKNRNNDDSKDRTSPTSSTSPSTSSASGSIHERVYNNALQYADYSAAIMALYYWMAEEPNRLDLKDSLATIYFTTGSNTQAVLLGQEILKSEPNNLKNLEMVAIAYSRLGLMKQALESYENLFRLTESARHLYQICVLEFKLERFGECEQHARALIAHPKATEELIGIGVGENQMEQVKAKAAALNVLGVLAKERKQYAEARQLFQAASEADPQFSLPRGNLADMDKDKQ